MYLVTCPNHFSIQSRENSVLNESTSAVCFNGNVFFFVYFNVSIQHLRHLFTFGSSREDANFYCRGGAY